MERRVGIGRIFFGAIGGYLVLGILVMVLFLAGAMFLGIERVLKPGEYAASTLWITIAAGITLVAAVAGGAAAALLGRDRRAGFTLASVVLLMGVVSGFTESQKPEPGPRPADATLVEIAQHGKEPVVTRVLQPLLGCVGVLAGSGVVMRRRETRASERQ